MRACVKFSKVSCNTVTLTIKVYKLEVYLDLVSRNRNVCRLTHTTVSYTA